MVHSSITFAIVAGPALKLDKPWMMGNLSLDYEPDFVWKLGKDGELWTAERVSESQGQFMDCLAV